MVLDDVTRDAHKVGSREKYIGVFIGILAVVLAVCSMGGSNAAGDATHRNIEAANTWSFFQAKNLRRHALRLRLDDLDMRLTADPNMNEETRKKITARIDEYKAQEKKLTSEPEKMEGLDELFAKGKALEVQRDIALKRGPYFDYGGALLQIAIVLASVAIISGGNFLLIVSLMVGCLGALATFGGFTLAFPLPF